VASSVNRAALPTIPRGVGIALPSQSLQRTYDLVTNVQANGLPATFPQVHQPQLGKNKQRKSSNDSNNKAITNSPGYGAVRGPNQIAVHLQTTTNSVTAAAAVATGAPK
jgi:hypothetical protein